SSAESPRTVLAVDLFEQIGVARVDQKVETAVAVPIGHAQLPPPAAAGPLVVQAQRLALFVEERAPRRQQHQPITAAGALERSPGAVQGEEGEVGKAVAVEVEHDRRGPPLRDELLAVGIPPGPSGLGWRAFPLDLDRLAGGQPRIVARAFVAQPADAAEDRV